MLSLLAGVLLSVTLPLYPAASPGATPDGTVQASVRVLAAVGWSGDQPVVLGFAHPQSWSVVTLDGTDILMLW